jgi:glycerophosphoryl diester phosphodiesterase
MPRSLLLLALALPLACRTPASAPIPRFDVQGHRGARALWPENTIPGFLGALDLGVTTLELDVVVSADDRVVVSHEPWFSAKFSTRPSGEPVFDERSHAIYALPYAEVRRYDVGRRGHPDFPRQRAIPAVKPTLDEVFAQADVHAIKLGRTLPRYNVEIKSRPAWDATLTPPPNRFAELVLACIDRANVAPRTTIQSFDPRALRAVHARAPDLPLALLVEGDTPRDLELDLAALGFAPAVYSPAHALVDAGLVDACHARGIRVIPWTVNDRARMAQLVALGVDGLITDSPDLALGLVR